MTKLETPVFQDELDKKTLDTFLKMLDHIKVNYISRQEYNDKKGNILEKTGEKDKLGEFYNLYLPSDLMVGEQVNIIYLLMNNFKLNIALLEPFLARTKVMIGIILRANKNLGTKEIEDLQQKYQFPKDFIDDIKNYSLKPDSKTREFIRQIKGTSKNKLGSENKEKAEEIYSKKLIQELDLTFFRKSLNDIRTGLEILSQADHKKIIKYIESKNKGNNPFKKEILDGIIDFERNVNGIDEIISIRNQNFDQEAKKLRDKILVDKLKSELEELRKTGNKEKIEEKELEIANIIIKELENGFHYILNGDENGYKPLEIQKTKEVQCVGFSIIGHSLLSEFGIKHKGLQIPEHSALEIHIGKDKYYFDATLGLNKLYRIIKEETQIGSIYKKYILKGTSYTYEAFSGDTEKIILSQIYNNKGSLLFELGFIEESIKMYNKAIEIDPKHFDCYKNKGMLFSKLKKHNLSDLYVFVYEFMIGKDNFDENKYSELDENKHLKEKSKIKEFITKQDFEGLRLYLISL